MLKRHLQGRERTVVLVTGAAGFIGSHLCERLLREGCRVIGIDNFDPFYDVEIKRRNLLGAMAYPTFSIVEADICNEESVASVFETNDVEVVVHLAARAGVRPSIAEPQNYIRTNIDGTATLLELTRRHEIKRFVFASSSSVYGNSPTVPFSEDEPVGRPISPYAMTKRAGELLCHTYHHLFDLSVICLRFFTVYGPRQRPDLAISKFTHLLLAQEPIPLFGNGKSARDYTYIDDIIDGVLGAIAYSGGPEPVYEIVNLGGSRTTTLVELVEKLVDLLGVEPRLQWLPPQPGDVERTYADISRAARLFGYESRTSIDEGLRRFRDWLQDEERLRSMGTALPARRIPASIPA